MYKTGEKKGEHRVDLVNYIIHRICPKRLLAAHSKLDLEPNKFRTVQESARKLNQTARGFLGHDTVF